MDSLKKPVIWIANHYATGPDIPGGSRHTTWAKELISRGYDVKILASSFHYLKYIETRTYSSGNYLQEEIAGVPFIWIKTHPYQGNTYKRFINMLSFAWRLYRLPALYQIPKPDIIIGSSVHLFTPFAAWLLAKKLKSRFILEIRDLWPETLIQLGWKKSNPFIKLLGWMEKFLYRRAEKIILLFPKAHEYIEGLNLGFGKEKTIWIPNGVNCADFNINTIPQPIEKELEFLNGECIKILNAGALGNVYALDKLIEAMQIVSESDESIRLYLIGNGPLEDELKTQVKTLGLQNVIFHDGMPKNYVPYMLQKADILYASLMKSPLYKYGMSLNKVHDYLAAGKPILFAVDSVNDPVAEAQAGITVSPDDSNAIAAAILKLAHLNPEERQQMGIKGKQHALENYDVKVLVDKLEPIFQKS